jgi:hypothetical protein
MSVWPTVGRIHASIAAISAGTDGTVYHTPSRETSSARTKEPVIAIATAANHAFNFMTLSTNTEARP